MALERHGLGEPKLEADGDDACPRDMSDMDFGDLLDEMESLRLDYPKQHSLRGSTFTTSTYAMPTEGEYVPTA